MDRDKTTVYLVQQGVWEMPLESMPLAAGYLKAHALANPSIRRQIDISIHNFRGGVTHATMANSIFRAGTPDIIAFSVFGWSYRSFGALAATFKPNLRGAR
jgi:radical SAM C-methyltransferase